MTTWNYRMTRETLPDGSHLFAVREVYYDDDGNPNGWGADPATFGGETALEVADSIARAAGCLAAGVLDLETRETLPPGDGWRRRRTPG